MQTKLFIRPSEVQISFNSFLEKIRKKIFNYASELLLSFFSIINTFISNFFQVSIIQAVCVLPVECKQPFHNLVHTTSVVRGVSTRTGLKHYGSQPVGAVRYLILSSSGYLYGICRRTLGSLWGSIDRL